MSAVQDPGMRSRDGKALAGERRLAGNQRVTFEALVEVGAESVGGFEAESVNISPEGIRLRTAYLPELGDRLVCRFDGFGGEVMAEGQVIWCKPEGRGGEFGVQFTRLDEFAAQVLESMCSPDEDEDIDPTDPPPEAHAAARGARVRLHIQGLGSPMRARVRDVTAGEVLIGSNLEFLKVGRDVELEDVDGGASHTAQIEHVDVAIDPESNIPQLIVALRCENEMGERAPESVDAVTAPIRVGRAISPSRAAALPPEPEITPEPMVTDRQDAGQAAAAEEDYESELDGEYTPASEAEAAAYTPHPDGADDHTPLSAQDGRVSHHEAPPSARFSAEHGEEEFDEQAPESQGSDEEPARFAGAKRRAGQLASRITPALNSAGAGAKGALGNILAKVRDTRRKTADRKRHKAAANAPKRRTAPPPSGALRSDGKRLFRESNPPAESKEGVAPKRTDRKRAIAGAVLGLVVVVGIYAAANQVSAWQQGQAPLPTLSKAADSENPAAAAINPAGAEPGSPIATANVPLFGATPLSTTEPVPVPPNVDMEGSDSNSEASGDSKKKLHLEKEWGVGTIDDPTVLKLKMDGPIEGIAGAEGATGFTLVIPNRKSISSAAGLARKDKRIESVNVVNYPDRAEVTVMFRGDVPAFLAKAKGKRLIIEVGSSKASKSSKKKRSKSKSKKNKSKRRR